MNNPKLLVVLFFGIILMSIMISIQMKFRKIAIWKSSIISIALVLTGLFGSRLWYYVENQSWGGRSFYGVIFIAPVVFYLISVVFRIPYSDTLDFCAPAGCMTLALVKIQCLIDGCCNGIVLYMDENRQYIRFPSQIVEMLVFLLISCVLFLLSLNSKNQAKIFPYFMISYGFFRFFLDFVREINEKFVWGLSIGSFWSIIAFVTGVCWLLLYSYINRSLFKTI